MKISFSMHEYHLNDNIKALIEKKFSHLNRFFQNEVVEAKIFLKTKNDMEIFDVSIFENGNTYHSEVMGKDMHKLIDEAYAKIESQIIHSKEHRK